MTTLPRISLVGLLFALMALPLGAEEISGAPEDPHHSDSEERQALPLEELQMFADVFNQIRQGYVESVPDSQLFELAVQGMLSGLDPHSVFLKEKAYDSLQETTQGEFSGLGIEIGQDGGYITIIAPIINGLDTNQVSTSDDARLGNQRKNSKAAVPGRVR